MPHHDAQACCIVGLCCDEELRKQALADRIQTYTEINAHKAREIADRLFAEGFIKDAESFLPPVVLKDIRETPPFEYHE